MFIEEWGWVWLSVFYCTLRFFLLSWSIKSKRSWLKSLKIVRKKSSRSSKSSPNLENVVMSSKKPSDLKKAQSKSCVKIMIVIFEKQTRKTWSQSINYDLDLENHLSPKLPPIKNHQIPKLTSTPPYLRPCSKIYPLVYRYQNLLSCYFS